MGLHVKHPLHLADFNRNWDVSTNVNTTPEFLGKRFSSSVFFFYVRITGQIFIFLKLLRIHGKKYFSNL
jgi:hypothetical protein